jgi:phytoene/squalene synthetase
MSYLICRLLDTVEDAPWSDLDRQQTSFRQFDAFLQHRPSRDSVAAWASNFPESIPAGEKALLRDAYQILADFHDAQFEERPVLAAPILSMSAGMAHYMKRRANEPDRQVRLRTLAEVNRYCFFVAGVVGEILTGLLRVQHAKSSSPDRLVQLDEMDACRFGLFLQKINLLKDQSVDEASGRHWLPDRQAVFRSVAEDACHAHRYFQAIPDGFEDFRLFCAWALYLGLASLPGIEQKLPRLEAFKLLGEIEASITDRDQLARLFDRLFARAFASLQPFAESAANASRTDSVSIEEARVVAELYTGRIERSRLIHLFT